MPNVSKLTGIISIALSMTLLLSSFSTFRSAKRSLEISEQLGRLSVKLFDKAVHSLHDVKRQRNTNLRSTPVKASLLTEYFRVKGLVSTSVDDTTLSTIFETSKEIADTYPALDSEILLSIIAVESNFNPRCSSDNDRSLGLMQVQPKHHADRANRLLATDFFSIHDSVLVGADYFSEMVDQYGTYSMALIAYNAGPSAANRHRKTGSITPYVERVLEIYTDISGIGDSIE